MVCVLAFPVTGCLDAPGVHTPYSVYVYMCMYMYICMYMVQAVHTVAGDKPESAITS